jgi:hypothetical protein
VFILDSLLIGSLRFVLDKVATAAEAELNDDSALREQLLETHMRLEQGEISEEEFVVLEREILDRIRAIKGTDQGGLSLMSDDVRVAGVEATVADGLDDA